jgi:hypothetical protein
MWAIGIRLYGVKLPWVQIAKITSISIVAALTARFLADRLPPLWAILAGGSAAVAVLLVLFYLMRVLEPEDQARFGVLSGMLPKAVGRPVDKIVSILIRPQLANVSPSNV